MKANRCATAKRTVNAKCRAHQPRAPRHIAQAEVIELTSPQATAVKTRIRRLRS
jgi:hypothetical protein